MKIIDDVLYDVISKIFPGITANELFEKDDNFSRIFISVFDHWLTEKESDEQLLDLDICKRNESRLSDLYKYIFKTHMVFFFVSSDYGGGAIMHFSSEEEYLDWVDLSIKERLFLRLIIPELKVIINGGYDYTLPTFLTKDADISKLEKIVHEHGLYILK